MMSGLASWRVSPGPVPATRADEDLTRTGQHTDRMYLGGTHGLARLRRPDWPAGLRDSAHQTTPWPEVGRGAAGHRQQACAVYEDEGRARHPRPRSRKGTRPLRILVGESSGAGDVSGCHFMSRNALLSRDMA